MFPYSFGIGWFVCNHCNCTFESSIFPSMELRCPFCGRIVGEDRGVIDDIIEWGVEFFSNEINQKTAIVGFESSASAINAFLIYADNGGAYIKFQKMSESFTTEELKKKLPESLWVKFIQGGKIMVANLYREDGEVRIDYSDWYKTIKENVTN